MSTSPSPSAHTTGYTTPSYPPISTVSSSSSLPMTTPKPKIPKVNVFSNDGSFLERFHKFKQDEPEKKDDILQRKRNFDDRFKNRGKRPPPVTTTPSSSSSVTSSDEDGPRPSKRSRSESSERST